MSESENESEPDSESENETEPESDPDDSLERLKRGDEEAWLEVYPMLRRRCIGVLLRMSMPEEDAEEIVHDAVLEAVRSDCFEKLSSFEELVRFVRSIAKYRGWDWFRKKNSQKGGGGKVDSLDEPVGQDGPAKIDKIPLEEKGMDPLEWWDILPALRACLEECLSVKESLLIRKFYLEQWTQREIAEKFGFKIGAIGTTIKRASNKLQDCLKKKGVDPLY